MNLRKQAKVMNGRSQLLFIQMKSMDKSDLVMALLVMDGYYVGHTYLTFGVAYINARLLARPTAGWLTQFVA